MGIIHADKISTREKRTACYSLRCYCFFRLVELESRKLRQLCMLTGEKRPVAGMSGCNVIPGQWSQIDQNLDLPKSRLYGYTGDPNYVKLGNGFSKNGKIVTKTKFAIDDSIGLPINHTAKAERQFVRPGHREAPVAHIARERTDCLFAFKTQLCEVTNVHLQHSV